MVVDSLALQARVPRAARRSRPAGSVPAGPDRRLVPDGALVAFVRSPDGAYSATSEGQRNPPHAPGRPGQVAGVGKVTLAAWAPAGPVEIQFEDRETPIRVRRRPRGPRKLGGDVV
jgi:hypothetical protein